MRTCSLADGHALSARSAALLLCALISLPGRVAGEDEPFAKRFDSGFATALIHDGVCTVALRQSSFTYATPYDCLTIVAAYRGTALDELPPEAVLARSLIALLRRDPTALVACYEEAAQGTAYRQFSEYLDSQQAKEEDPAHLSAALIAGALVADTLFISYRFQDRSGQTMVQWFARLARHGRGWRLTAAVVNDFPGSFSATCTSAMAAHGALADDQLARMSLCRILPTPTVHAQLVHAEDLRPGDLAMAVLLESREPPLRFAGAADAIRDAGLLALDGASRLYAGAGGDAGTGGLWLNGNPAVIPASPFAAEDGKPPLRFCHGAIRGDACSIYLLGDGHAVSADVMLCASGGVWKIMNRSPADSCDGGLWQLTAKTRLWSQLAELLRTRAP